MPADIVGLSLTEVGQSHNRCRDYNIPDRPEQRRRHGTAQPARPGPDYVILTIILTIMLRMIVRMIVRMT